MTGIQPVIRRCLDVWGYSWVWVAKSGLEGTRESEPETGGPAPSRGGHRGVRKKSLCKAPDFWSRISEHLKIHCDPMVDFVGSGFCRVECGDLCVVWRNQQTFMLKTEQLLVILKWDEGCVQQEHAAWGEEEQAASGETWWGWSSIQGSSKQGEVMQSGNMVCGRTTGLCGEVWADSQAADNPGSWVDFKNTRDALGRLKCLRYLWVTSKNTPSQVEGTSETPALVDNGWSWGSNQVKMQVSRQEMTNPWKRRRGTIISWHAEIETITCFPSQGAFKLVIFPCRSGLPWHQVSGGLKLFTWNDEHTWDRRPGSCSSWIFNCFRCHAYFLLIHPNPTSPVMCTLPSQSACSQPLSQSLIFSGCPCRCGCGWSHWEDTSLGARAHGRMPLEVEQGLSEQH